MADLRLVVAALAVYVAPKRGRLPDKITLTCSGTANFNMMLPHILREG